MFIRLKHIGDALLLTPTLAATKQAYPQATIWVVVRRGTEGILAGCAAIDRLLTMAAPEASNRTMRDWWRDAMLIKTLRAEKFDYAFELSHGDRGRALAWLSGATKRCTNGAAPAFPAFWRRRFNCLTHFDWSERHQVEAAFHTVAGCLPLLSQEPPPLVFERAAAQPCAVGAALTDYAIFHPAARWARKRWPLNNWILVGQELLKRVGTIVISVGPDEHEVQLGKQLAHALGPRAVSTQGTLSWAQLAGLLFGAKLFVGVDTAAMHLAAACQCPTVAIFGDSVAKHWHPWAVRHRLVLPALSAEAAGPTHRSELIQHVPVLAVLQACEALLASQHQIKVVSGPPSS